MSSHPVIRRVNFRIAAIVALLAACSSDVFAAGQPGDVDLSPTPPDVTASVDPNVLVTFDDSGSMMATAMPDQYQGDYSQQYYYSSTTNLIYFDPTKQYPPPPKPDGTQFPNATYTNAWRDGICANWSGSYCFGSANTTNLSTNFYYRFRNGTSTSSTSNSTGQTDIPSSIRGYQNGGFWYDCPTPASNTGCVLNLISNHPELQQNFANWYSYYRTRNLMTRTSVARAFGVFGENIRVTWQTINADPMPTNRGIQNLAGTWRNQFFSWLYNIHTTGSTPDRAATIRAGKFYERSLTQDVLDPYWNGLTGTQSKDLECRQNFNMLVTDGYWNEGDPTLPSGFFTAQDTVTLPLPDASTGLPNPPPYPDSPYTTIFSNVEGTTYTSSMANIAFYYWAHDLQPTLANRVPPYIANRTTGFFPSSPPLTPGENPLSSDEIYYNPANDPATWQHVVQFMITLGVAGNLNYPGDFSNLRNGTLQWPRPVNNSPPAVDDTWHGAVNSRGSYFSASNPTALVQQLTNIINNILSRKGASTALSATMSTLTAGTQGYSAGYDTSDYSGFLIKQDLDTTGTPGAVVWDAGCILTGGTLSAASECDVSNPPPNVDSGRKILTSNSAGTLGRAFEWSQLDSAEQSALNQDPSSTTVCTSPTATTGGCDGNGQLRLNWLRGDRTNESTAPLLRHRTSVLGAIINSQPQYVSAPTGGFSDNFPPNSPEAVAATPDSTGRPGAGSYAEFVQQNKNRPPTVYVGSNDGMLHAFNGVDGSERWAYVPSMLFSNGHLNKIATESVYKNFPGVDNTPVIQDVFIHGAWHTVLIGSMRLGGRGIFALDVTAPDGINESSTSTVLWEINNTKAGFGDLGYTYSYPNIARLSDDKWVVLLASSYFPLPNQSPPDPAASETAANRTSLFVIDLETGAKLAEIDTTTAPQGAPPQTYGLSTPFVYDLNSDQVDDVAVAGDLAGNLWRFDLSGCPDGTPAGPNPSGSPTMICGDGSTPSSGNWKVDLIFKTYGTNDANVGRLPISVMPVGMRDRAANVPVWVFGTGKYLGLCDRTATAPPSGCGPDSNTATQYFFGVKDDGARSVNYPFLPSQLNTWTLSQDAAFVRTLTLSSTVANNRGWRIPLNVAAEPGERNVVTAVPYYSANYVILTTLIPKGDDPCDPGRRGSIIAVDGGTGGPLAASPLGGAAGPSGSGNDVVGKVVDSNAIPIAGIPAVVGSQGGPLLLPGLPDFAIPAPPPHRGSWRELLDQL